MITEYQAREQFDQCLDEEGTVTIAGITFDRSYILREMDPVAYDTGFANFCDAYGYDFDEDDGQPTEQEEWASFDPDC
jgi:hypothetical protein